ncbi:MAG TPA: hypothetical protein VNG12_03955 [Acidimicrobiales bacterium]|nr:hypothetical protein [Acidimicrobiales bacterium]
MYDSFLQRISGLDDYLNQSWVQALRQDATAQLTAAAERQAESLLKAHEHGTGTLVDDHQVVEKTSSTTASIFDCLNEQQWYLVEDNGNRPDPGVVRGDFVGIANLVNQNGEWFVDVWQPSQRQCRF